MSFARLIRAAGQARTMPQLDAVLQVWAAQDAEQERYNRARAHGVDLGLYEWYSLNHPWTMAPALEDAQGLIEGQKRWVWCRLHKLECFHRKPKSARPCCGAKTRSGAPCKARVVEKPDGTLAKRCRMHGGKSTGARTEAGREAIRESNRRRARKRNEDAAST